MELEPGLIVRRIAGLVTTDQKSGIKDCADPRQLGPVHRNQMDGSWKSGDPVDSQCHDAVNSLL